MDADEDELKKQGLLADTDEELSDDDDMSIISERGAAKLLAITGPEAAAMKALVICYDERVLAICNSEAGSRSTVVKRMLALLDEEAQSSLNTVERWDI